MGEYLYTDPEVPKLDHPDAAIRLASVVHRFGVPRMSSNRKISFAKSFKTVGQHPKTRKLVLNADDCRQRLHEACQASKISSERVVNDARRYIPLIHNILVSCKVQPENARLDEKLVFEWMSGVEEDAPPKAFLSEAIMYDLTMAIACEGLGRAMAATEQSVAGQFTAASREYAAAAGIMQFLHQEHLPKWVSKGANVVPEKLPSECHVPATRAFQTLFMANGQQMAIATVLMKPGVPNYSLLGKLCYGVMEMLEDFTAAIRKEASIAKERMDKDFFVLMSFQIGIQSALSLYFQAQAAWKNMDHGVAIALMSEATVALRTRDTVYSATGLLPDIAKTPALVPLKKDLQDFRKHCLDILRIWEKDNSSVYFAAVPQTLSADKKLQEGLKMNKLETYQLEEADPALLVLPEGILERSDSDLARELQEKLNAGEG